MEEGIFALKIKVAGFGLNFIYRNTILKENLGNNGCNVKKVIH